MRRAVASILLVLSAPVARAQVPTTVILVRHAERESLTTPDPPLTAAGQQRAQALLFALRDAGVQAIITTQFRRTTASAQPLAAALGITPEVIPDTGAQHANEVARAIRSRYAGQTVLVVGHGHTVPAIIAALGATAPPPICETVFDQLFVVTVPATGPPRVVNARYGAKADSNSGCGDTHDRRFD